MAHQVGSSQISSMLQHAGFGDQPANLKSADPIVISQVILKLEQIKIFDKNPRKSINSKYGQIKQSIKKQGGLTNNFNVTRRPGEEHYIIQSGGNTRYAVLKELYKETGDECFNLVNCLYIPWVSEATILTNHLIENLLRGDMVFIDQAHAVASLKLELEEEHNKTLSGREFEDLSKQLGFDISRRNASRMTQAIELDEYIPCAMRGGLSVKKLDQLKTLKSECYRVKDLTSPQIDALYANTLSALDGDVLDIGKVRNLLCTNLAKATNNTIAVIEIIMTDDAQSDVIEPKITPKSSTKNRKERTKNPEKQFLETGFGLAHAIGVLDGCEDVIIQSDIKPGYEIKAGRHAPLPETPFFIFLSALLKQEGKRVFTEIDLLQIDDQTFDLCLSLLKHCR